MPEVRKAIAPAVLSTGQSSNTGSEIQGPALGMRLDLVVRMLQRLRLRGQVFSHVHLTQGASRLLDGELSCDQAGDHLHLFMSPPVSQPDPDHSFAIISAE